MENNQNPEKSIKNNNKRGLYLAFVVLVFLGSILAVVGNVMTALHANANQGMYENYFGTLLGCLIGAGLFLILAILAIFKIVKLAKKDAVTGPVIGSGLILKTTIVSALYFIEKYVLDYGCNINAKNVLYLLIVGVVGVILFFVIAHFVKIKGEDKSQAFRYTIVFGLFFLIFSLASTIFISEAIDPILGGGPNQGSMTIVGYLLFTISSIIYMATASRYKLTAEEKKEHALAKENDKKARALEIENKKKDAAISTKEIAKKPDTKQYTECVKVDLNSISEEFRPLLEKDFTPAIHFEPITDTKLIDQTLDAYGPEVKAVAMKELEEFTKTVLALNKQYGQKDLCCYNMGIVRVGLSPLVAKILRVERIDLSKNNKQPCSGIYQKEYSAATQAAALNRGKERNHYVTTLINLLLDEFGSYDNSITLEKVNKGIAKFGTCDEADVLLGIDRGHEITFDNASGSNAETAPAAPKVELSEEEQITRVPFPVVSNRLPNDAEINAYYEKLKDGPVKEQLLIEYKEFLHTFNATVNPFGQLTGMNMLNCYICIKGMSPALRQMLRLQDLDLSNSDHRKIVGMGEQMSQEEMTQMVTSTSKEESRYHDIEINLINFELSKPQYQGLDDITKYNKFIEIYGLSEYITKVLGFVREK